MTAVWISVVVGLTALAGLGVVLWNRGRQRSIDAQVASQIDASIERFRAETVREQLDEADEDRRIIEESLNEPPPNVDLPRDSRDATRERLLRAAQAQGGDAARAQLAELLASTDARKPGT